MVMILLLSVIGDDTPVNLDERWTKTLDCSREDTTANTYSNHVIFLWTKFLQVTKLNSFHGSCGSLNFFPDFRPGKSENRFNLCLN